MLIWETLGFWNFVLGINKRNTWSRYIWLSKSSENNQFHSSQLLLVNYEKIVYQYIQSCHICRRAKALKDWYNVLLNSLVIFTYFWINVTLDFVTKLSFSNGYIMVLMKIDSLTKEKHNIFCTIDINGIIAEVITYLLLNNVWKLYSLPLSFISDGGF